MTLQESQNPCNITSIYLIEFVSATTFAKYFTVVEDKSPSPCRYQLFCITETGGNTVDAMLGQTSLSLQGQYHYRAYANPNSALDPTGLQLLEVGKALVTGQEPTEVAYQSAVNPELVAYVNTDLDL